MKANDTEITLLAPSKINLFLSVHGARADGFHELSSLLVPLKFGDDLTVRIGAGVDRLICDSGTVPLDGSNLILKAANAFRSVSGQAVFFDFELVKRIPVGAGLGGGSSDAVAALKAMNALCGEPLSRERLIDLSAGLGSDCPFFVDAVPASVSGRGELMVPLESSVKDLLLGQRILLFKPDFGIHTAWAYGMLKASAPEYYEAKPLANERMERFRANGSLAELLFNSFEAAVGHKYLAIPTLLGQLRTRGVACLMSGSGSCCFALIGADTSSIRQQVSDSFGESVFLVETSIG